MDEWLNRNLVCPRDQSKLHRQNSHLVCTQGHDYPVVDGLPVMLIREVMPTHAHCHLTLAKTDRPAQLSGAEPVQAGAQMSGSTVDPFVQQAVGESCGFYFVSAIGRLTDYPIPELRLPQGHGGILLDAGCNWGRWCLAAARLGYRPVGIDPAIDAVQAARRVARQLGVEAAYIVADARHLPFRPGTFDVAHSYSVLMHFAKDDAKAAVSEMARCLKPGGTSLIQMANAYGPRNMQVQVARGFHRRFERSSFATRYWTPGELSRLFEGTVGASHMEAEGFFSTSSGSYTMRDLPRRYRFALAVSAFLVRLSRLFPVLKYAADSLYMRSTRKDGSPVDSVSTRQA